VSPPPSAAPHQRHVLPFVLVTIFIDSIGIGLVIPVLPRLLMTVGNVELSGAIALGAWMGLGMAVASFFAAPLLGNLSDAIGRRPVLLFSLAGLALDYVLMAFANSIPLIFIGRLLSGVFGGSFGAAQASVADVSAPEQRARNFGLISAAFGVGFTVGPAIGGLLSEFGPRAPFLAAAGLAALNFLYGLVFFPDTLKPENRRRFSLVRANPLGAWRSMRALPGMTRAALVLLAWQIASLVYPLTWAFYGIAQLGWSDRMIGFSLAGVGVVIALSQGFLTGPVVRRFGERDAASIGLIGAGTAFACYAFVTSTAIAIALFAFIAVQSLVQPSLMAILSRRASADTQGEVQGISAMAMGTGSMIAPMVLTWPMAQFTGPQAAVQFPGAPYLVAAGFALLALAMLRRLPRDSQ
jgi:MFS transporter, DHA1 family, tetracycline resistance protein